MRFDCPECAQGIEVEARYIGKEANCPHCKKLIQVPMVSGDVPPATIRPEDIVETDVRWTRLPWSKSASVDNALRIALLGVGVAILVFLIRIDLRMASWPTVEDYLREKGGEVPYGMTESEERAPMVAIPGGVPVTGDVDVKVQNLADDPVPVRVRE
ncbi:RDD domain-containing protein [Haloferula helveola]|uniref:RDD domain-containing protein n=1 Tax=Haloferula helveola TaxID=490095 RepID=A0ABN6H813_9BACT|nr:RDD domain-containing protein [Haloferula helveola]